MHGLKAKLEAISTQRCAVAQPHWHSRESPSSAMPHADQILPRVCESSPNLHRGQLLTAAGLGTDGVQGAPTVGVLSCQGCHHLWPGQQMPSPAIPLLVPCSQTPPLSPPGGSCSLPSSFPTHSGGGTCFGGVVSPQGEQGGQCISLAPVLIPLAAPPCLPIVGGSSASVDDSQLVPEDSATGSSPPFLLCRPSHPLSWGLFELFTHPTVSPCGNYNSKTLW